MILPMIIVMTLSFPTTYAEHNLNLHPKLSSASSQHPSQPHLNLYPLPISRYIHSENFCCRQVCQPDTINHQKN